MTSEGYYMMIIFILMGLTFITLFLLFLYMIYGEKEEELPSQKTAIIKNILDLSLYTQIISSPFWN